MNENQEQAFVVMAKPGPAFAVSREEFKKLKENNNAKQNREALRKRISSYGNFFNNIKDETKKPEEKEL